MCPLHEPVLRPVSVISMKTVLSQICCFGGGKVMLFQILLDGAEPRDAGTTWFSSPVR